NIDYLLQSVVADGGLSFARVHDHAAFEAWRERAGGDGGPPVTVHPDRSYGTSHEARANGYTPDGRVLTRGVAADPGSREIPRTAAQVRARARWLIEPVLGITRTRDLLALVERLPALDDVRDLTRLLSADDPER